MENLKCSKHYYEIHIPLAKKIPGLRKYEVSQGSVVSPTGHAAYLVAILYFDDMVSLKEVFSSPEGQACAVDRKKLAQDDEVQIFLFDNKEV